MFTIKTMLRSPEGESSGGGANPFAPSTQSAPAAETPAVSPAQSNAEQALPAHSTQPTTQSTPRETTPVAAAQTPVVATPPTPVAPNMVAMSPEQLQQLAASMRQPAAPTQQGAPQMTEAEFKKQFNVFEADEASYEATFGVKPTPAQLSAYNNHLQAIARQAVTINKHLMDQRISQLEGQFRPVQQTLEQQEQQAHFNSFVTEYPGLKDHGALLKEIVDAARGRGMQFENIGAAKQFVAAQAAKLLGRQLESFKTPVAAGVQSNQTTPQQSGNRSMSTTSMGGRSGASGGAAPTVSTAERLFQSAS